MSKGLASFVLILLTSAFQSTPDRHEIPHPQDGRKLVTLHSDEFQAYSDRVYRQIEYPVGYDTLEKRVLDHALRRYTYLKHTEELTETKYLTVIDFSLYCNKKRLWVIDMDSKKVVFNEWVAHGAKSSDTYAKYFSNKHSSNKSSLGFYTTGGLYNGSNKLSLKLNGLEKGFNDNAFARGVVIHGANYISEEIVNRNDRIGRSYGLSLIHISEPPRPY